MNQRSYLRLAIHIAVVAAALALGFVVRGMLPAKSYLGAVTRTTGTKEALSAEAPPLTEKVKPRLVAEYSDVEFAALQDRIRNISRCVNPLREQLMIREELVAGISSVGDFQRAVELLEASGAEVGFHHETVTALAERLAESDPAAATTATSVIKDRQLRSAAIAKMMETWAKCDPLAALAYVQEQGLNVKSTALDPIFREFAKRDPAGAMARVNEFKEPGVFHALDRTVLSEWWTADRDAAVAWITGREPEERKKLMRTLVEVAGGQDPEATWKLVQSLPATDKPEGWSMFGLFSSWAGKDPNAAFDAALSETDSARRGEILQHIARGMKAGENSKEAEDRNQAMLAKLPDESSRQQFLFGLAEGSLHGGSQDYRRVLDLTTQLTDEMRRLDMMRIIGGNWSRTDAPTASEWLITMQPGTERDAAIGEFVRGTFESDPAAALTWSAAIADDGKRSRRLMELYPQWLKSDATAATAWLAQQTKLSQEDRAALEAGANVP